ncbi:MAG: 50S ribosomal protein L10 [Patescibacteria group bacterium]
MLTKQQKTEQIKEISELLKNNQLLVFTDFSGTSVEDLKKLRGSLMAGGAKLKVFKKRLLGISLKEGGFDFDPNRFESQLATIFSDKDIPEVAALVYKFFKAVEKKGFKILGAYNLAAKNFLDAETVQMIGKLPSREVLLAQVAGMLAAPIKMFLYVLNEKAKMVEIKK